MACNMACSIPTAPARPKLALAASYHNTLQQPWPLSTSKANRPLDLRLRGCPAITESRAAGSQQQAQHLFQTLNKHMNHAVITHNARRSHFRLPKGRHMHAGWCVLLVRISLTIILILIAIILISWVRHKRRLMIFPRNVSMNFLADNASFDSTFDHHPRGHDTFEEHPSVSYLGRLETIETYLDHFDHRNSIQNISRELHHASWNVNDIQPSDFGRNLLDCGMSLEYVDSYPPGSQLLSTSPSESLTHPGNVPLAPQESSSLPGDIVPNSNARSPTEWSSADLAGDIQCRFPICEKMFTSITTYNHHFRNHAKPFQCPIQNCSARHATTRHLDRHVNERHSTKEKYFCPVKGCKRSMLPINAKPFPRPENCKRHIVMVHRTREEQVKALQMDMDDETKRIRRERQIGR